MWPSWKIKRAWYFNWSDPEQAGQGNKRGLYVKWSSPAWVSLDHCFFKTTMVRIDARYRLLHWEIVSYNFPRYSLWQARFPEFLSTSRSRQVRHSTCRTAKRDYWTRSVPAFIQHCNCISKQFSPVFIVKSQTAETSPALVSCTTAVHLTAVHAVKPTFPHPHTSGQFQT